MNCAICRSVDNQFWLFCSYLVVNGKLNNNIAIDIFCIIIMIMYYIKKKKKGWEAKRKVFCFSSFSFSQKQVQMKWKVSTPNLCFFVIACDHLTLRDFSLVINCLTRRCDLHKTRIKNGLRGYFKLRA